MASRPILSIVIAMVGTPELSPQYRGLIRNAIESDNTIEIILSHQNAWDLENLPANQCVITIHVSTKPSILNLWGRGLSVASGRYLATLDSRCPPEEGWIEGVLATTRRGVPCFYGSVEPGSAYTNINTLGYLVEYAQFKSPNTCDSEYPGNNIVFDASLLDSQKSIEQFGFQKTFMFLKLERTKGIKPTFIEGMSIVYCKEYSLIQYLSHLLNHGRCFAANRLRQESHPPRSLCILFSPLLGLLRTLRLFRFMCKKTDLLLTSVLYLPLILIAEHSWAFGEFLGYGLGDGGACSNLD